MENINLISDLDISGKKVFLRTDYNVPLDGEGNIKDDFRIKESIPTIKLLLKKGASQIFIASHFGRPEGKEAKYRMDIIAEKLFFLLKRKVEKIDEAVDCEELLPSPDESRLVLLENLRFYSGETSNEEAFAKSLAGLADVYVNDAFSVCHREHASVHKIVDFFDDVAIGLLVEKELKAFDLIHSPAHPFYALIGGSKLETKLNLISHLGNKVDKILLGGAMIFTFYKAKGLEVGKSVHSDVKNVAQVDQSNLKLPSDVVLGTSPESTEELVTKVDNIPAWMMGLDIGPDTIKEFSRDVKKAKLIVWNGPLGYCENPVYAKGTLSLAKVLADCDAKVIVGGGDTASVIPAALREKFYHISTGGGASLKLLEGTGLPAIIKLESK